MLKTFCDVFLVYICTRNYSDLPTSLTVWCVVFRLRSFKMEQRKLSDQATTLIDFAKVG